MKTKSKNNKNKELKYNFLKEDCSKCYSCLLYKNRHKSVFGVGNLEARLMFVGEGPGEDENKQGKPFVGRAGKLLTKMIKAMGFKRSEVYISNIVKCHSATVNKKGKSVNCPPTDYQADVCSSRYLNREIALVRPDVVILLGKTATSCVYGETVSISKVRGKFKNIDGVTFIPTFHPAYLLRNPAAKSDCWKDLQKVMKRIGESNVEI